MLRRIPVYAADGIIAPMMTDAAAPTLPTRNLVRAACNEFDENNSIVESALSNLFNQYPHNDNEAHVLLKVVALNRLYSTNILAVFDMARHIYSKAHEIDSGLVKGAPEVAGVIATFTVPATGKPRISYSFASKYCSWHNQTAYPIWDSIVGKYLLSLRRTDFARFLTARGPLWNYYPEFVELMTNFRNFYGLGEFSFKEIDKFIWAHGGRSSAMASVED